MDLNIIYQFPYTEAVVKEVLRLYPPAPVAPRYVNVPNLKLGGKIVPIGVNARMNIAALHRNEEYWPCAEKFIPERFLVSG